MGHMAQLGIWAMGYRVQWGTGLWAHGQWHRAMRYRGYRVEGLGHMGNGCTGGNVVQGSMGCRGMGHMLPMCSIAHVPHCPCVKSLLSPSRSICIIKQHTCSGYMSHVPLWPPAVMSWGGLSNVSESQKMSSCQKDVKCQKIKYLDYAGSSQKN